MKHRYQTTLLFLLFTTAALAQTFKPTSHWRAGGGLLVLRYPPEVDILFAQGQKVCKKGY